MPKARNQKGKKGNMTNNHTKSRGFSQNIILAAEKHAVKEDHFSTIEYKELVRRHAAAIAFISEREERELDLMVRDFKLLKAGKL
ncbi:hypothetical protein [Chitinophaga sancti]|uniref:hypothetical protein n=1 Tax=Chitinophaga sancti TaxID=1004 RepID=UPI003F78E275